MAIFDSFVIRDLRSFSQIAVRPRSMDLGELLPISVTKKLDEPMAAVCVLKQLRLIVLLLAFFSNAVQAESAMAMTVEDSLKTIRSWLQANAAPLNDELNAPASTDDISAFEAESGLTLPGSVRAAYAAHNGEKVSSDGIFGTWRWLPLDEVVANRQQLLESGAGWTGNAIPILLSGGGDYFFVESVDAENGESPVFEWWHEQPTRDAKYPNFAAMLENFAELLERGQYVYLPDELAGLIDRDDL